MPLPFSIHRRIPIIRRPFHERDVALAERDAARLALRKAGGFSGSPYQRYGHLTYSQHGEDLVFAALLERFGIEHPTYLDIGANHPVDCSNTALLYKRGARGVNIDANPDAVELFRRERPDDVNLNIGVAAKAGRMTFYRIDPMHGRNTFIQADVETVLSWSPDTALHDQFEIDVITLDEVIDTYCGGQCPDLLSIDVEGLDYEILATASLRTRPKILCVETVSVSGDIETALDDMLTERGFRKCIQMFNNAVYIEQDRVL